MFFWIFGNYWGDEFFFIVVDEFDVCGIDVFLCCEVV